MAWFDIMMNKKGKRKMKKRLKLFVTMLLALTVAMSAILPTVAFAQGDAAVCGDEGVMPCNNWEYEYKYDENGRLMYRIWDNNKGMYITDWIYV